MSLKKILVMAVIVVVGVAVLSALILVVKVLLTR